ncbi:MAG: U32 family peptidase [Coriobacteriia bacterium]
MSEAAEHTRVPELLAPAGGPDALHAAVANGADAVYLGLEELNARRGAENFSLPGLREACDWAHLRGVRVYLTANVVVLPNEMPRALTMIDEAWTAGVDAVIVQDLGLAVETRALLPHVRLHASTQLNAHDPQTVRVLADVGFARITLARECSIEEVTTAAAASSAEVETFVHGSLCYCYSGQCLMSSLIGARSANRGLCAQPCRLPHRLVDEDGREAQTGGAYLLSPRDLAGIEVLPRLVRSGIAALKIEGRMKSPEYVALVVRVYRAALDRAALDPEGFQVSPVEWETLEEAFNRGFSTAYLTGVKDESMMSRSRPNNRGVPLGRVVDIANGLAVVALDRSLEPGDTIEVWTRDGRFAQTAGGLAISGSAVSSAPASSRVSLRLERSAAVGDRVFRVANAALIDAARRTFRGPDAAAVPVDLAVKVRVGEPIVVEATARGACGRGEGPVVELARTRTVTAEEVIGHVGRLGGSGFAARGWDLDLDAQAGLPFSTLHAARREALERLRETLLRPWAGRVPARPDVGRPTRPRSTARSKPALVAVTDDPGVATALYDAGADRVAVDALSVPEGPWPQGMDVRLPRVAHDGESRGLLERIPAGARVMAGTLGLLTALRSHGSSVEADWPLNACNPSTVAALADLGADLVWASPELSGRQLASTCEGSAVDVGFVVHGRLEMMIAEHCALQAAGPCACACADCDRRRTRWTLVDAKGYAFPVSTDSAGRTHVLNSVPLDLSRALPEIVRAGVAAVRLELTGEERQDAIGAVASYRRSLDAIHEGLSLPVEAFVKPSTSGHFFRGVR